MLAAFLVKHASEPHLNVGFTGCKGTASLNMAILRSSWASIARRVLVYSLYWGVIFFIIFCYIDLRFFAMSEKKVYWYLLSWIQDNKYQCTFLLAGFCGKSRFCTTFSHCSVVGGSCEAKVLMAEKYTGRCFSRCWAPMVPMYPPVCTFPTKFCLGSTEIRVTWYRLASSHARTMARQHHHD